MSSLTIATPQPMTSDEAADNAEDPERSSFIIMHATETFDGQERVMTRTAYDLQILATAHSASRGHPGFVPDDYLEHLDGLAIEATITAVELCTIGLWQRVDGGNRVLDWKAVEVCLDQVHASAPGKTTGLRPENATARPWSGPGRTSRWE